MSEINDKQAEILEQIAERAKLEHTDWVNVDDVHLRRTAGAGDAAQVSTDQWWYLGHLEPGGPAILRSSDDCKACWDALLKERK